MTTLTRIAAFLDAQAAEAGAARNTVLAYGRDLKDFAGWLEGKGLTLDGMTRDINGHRFAAVFYTGM